MEMEYVKLISNAILRLLLFLRLAVCKIAFVEEIDVAYL